MSQTKEEEAIAIQRDAMRNACAILSAVGIDPDGIPTATQLLVFANMIGALNERTARIEEKLDELLRGGGTEHEGG